MSIRATIQGVTAGLEEYVRKMDPSDDLLSECFRQQKPRKEEEPGGGYHGKTSPCTACTISKLKEWLTLGEDTNSWKWLD